jgi:hypothetical protein
LAVIHTTVKSGRDVEVWLMECGKWFCHIIKEAKQVKEFQYRLASYPFESDSSSKEISRVPIAEILHQMGNSRIQDGCEILAFTASMDKNLIGQFERVLNICKLIEVVCIVYPEKKTLMEGQLKKFYTTVGIGDYWVISVDEDMMEIF